MVGIIGSGYLSLDGAGAVSAFPVSSTNAKGNGQKTAVQLLPLGAEKIWVTHSFSQEPHDAKSDGLRIRKQGLPT